MALGPKRAPNRVRVTHKIECVVLTRSVTHGRVERSTQNPNVKGLVRRGQAFDMLEMGKGRNARETPLTSQF